jgi:hypothetical protein
MSLERIRGQGRRNAEEGRRVAVWARMDRRAGDVSNHGAGTPKVSPKIVYFHVGVVWYAGLSDGPGTGTKLLHYAMLCMHLRRRSSNVLIHLGRQGKGRGGKAFGLASVLTSLTTPPRLLLLHSNGQSVPVPVLGGNVIPYLR